MNENIFWTNNITVLYQNYLDFIPTKTMTRYEQYNAITRFCIYLIILSIIFRAQSLWYTVPIIIIILIAILMHLNVLSNNNPNGNETENISENLLNQVNNTTIDENLARKNVKFIEAGYYNPDGTLTLPSDYKKRANKKRKCKMPTTDNPYMNPEANDALEYSPPVACNSDDIDVDNLNKNISNAFNDQLFRDVSDLYNVKNSQRQFYTISGSKTPDTVGFANWLYGNMPSCKSNQSDCNKYENLAQSRQILK